MEHPPLSGERRGMPILLMVYWLTELVGGSLSFPERFVRLGFTLGSTACCVTLKKCLPLSEPKSSHL